MVDVTLQTYAVTEVDGRQLRQGLEALEVACSRRTRVRGRVSAWTILPERSVVALRQHVTRCSWRYLTVTCHFEPNSELCQVDRLDGRETLHHIRRSLLECLVRR